MEIKQQFQHKHNWYSWIKKTSETEYFKIIKVESFSEINENFNLLIKPVQYFPEKLLRILGIGFLKTH